MFKGKWAQWGTVGCGHVPVPTSGPQTEAVGSHLDERSLCWRQVTAGDDGQEKPKPALAHVLALSYELVAPAGTGMTSFASSLGAWPGHSGGQRGGRACLADLGPSPSPASSLGWAPAAGSPGSLTRHVGVTSAGSPPLRGLRAIGDVRGRDGSGRAGRFLCRASLSVAAGASAPRCGPGRGASCPSG